MQNIPAGLIPYNHELYLTGKYIAETRVGFRPTQVVKMEGGNNPIVYIDDQGYTYACYEDGMHDFIGYKSNYDLFLRPKTVKKWALLTKGLLFETKKQAKEHASYFAEDWVEPIEVEVNEE